MVWALAVLLIAVQATSLVASERSHQTIDLLLASPMTSREIILQKHYSVRRLMYVLGLPLVTIFLFESWFAMGTPGLEDGPKAVLTVPLAALASIFFHFDYILCSVLSVVIYLPLCSWIAFLIGIKSRSQVRALLVTLLLLFGWAFLPVLVFVNDQPEVISRITAPQSPDGGGGLSLLTVGDHPDQRDRGSERRHGNRRPLDLHVDQLRRLWPGLVVDPPLVPGPIQPAAGTTRR